MFSVAVASVPDRGIDRMTGRKAATDAERSALDAEIVLGQSAMFTAQSQQISAEAAFDRYRAAMPRR